MRRRTDRKRVLFNSIGYVYIIFFTLVCFIPFWLMISGSLTNESEILKNGFSFFPQKFSIYAYSVIFRMPDKIGRAYFVSIALTVCGTGIGLILTSMTAYVLHRKDFKYRNYFSFYFYFTTLFSGGLVPFYLLIVKQLHLKNTFLAMLLPSLMSAWLTLLMRNYMNDIPDSIIESAKIDGTGDFKIFTRFILPLSGPGLATIGLFIALGYWNDWYLAMLFMEKSELYPLQYLLYKLLQSVEGLKNASSKSGIAIMIDMPEESLKMATAVIVTGPIIFLYPFVQRYFVKGLTIGSVKG